MRTKRVLRAAVAFLFAFGVLAADLTPLRLPPQTASAVTQADIDKLKKESNALSSKKSEVNKQLQRAQKGQGQHAQAQGAARSADRPSSARRSPTPSSRSRSMKRSSSRPSRSSARRRRRSGISTSCSASACARWRSAGRCPTGQCFSSRRALRSCSARWTSSAR